MRLACATGGKEGVLGLVAIGLMLGLTALKSLYGQGDHTHAAAPASCSVNRPHSVRPRVRASVSASVRVVMSATSAASV